MDTKIEDKAQLFLNDEVTTIEDAIEGAKDIIAERISDNPQYRSKILKDVFNQGLIVSSKKKKAEDEKQTFSMYYDYKEPIKRIANPVSYTHLTLPTKSDECRSRWSPYH